VDGRLIACDVIEEWTAIGHRYWQEAGVAHKIDLRIAPALETLDGLLSAGHAGTFDFAFIDADKPNYNAYYERILQLLRPYGLVAIDNTLWGGRVADETVQDENTVALRALNAKLRDDPRVSLSVLPIGDGLTLALKRS
jgi:caffeoyl-CoA O-methyltransferase